MDEAENAGNDLSAEELNAAFENPEATASPTETPGEVATDATAADEPAAEEAPQYAQITVAELADLKASAARVEELKATLEKVSGTAFGKMGGIERQLKELTSGPGPEISQEAIDTLREDGFEPLAQALEGLKKLRVIPGTSAQADPDALFATLTPKVEQAIETRLLSREHPDWKQIDADPAWSAFVQTLPQDRQAALVQASQSYDSSVISREMTAFKQAKAQAAKDMPKPAAATTDPAAARRSRMQAAVTPRGASSEAGENPLDAFNAGFTG